MSVWASTSPRSLLALAALALACRQPTAPPDAAHPVPSRAASTPPVSIDAGVTTPSAPHFAPAWQCRITGLGHVAHPMRVNVPPPPRSRDPRAIDDEIPLESGGTLERHTVRNATGVDPRLARVVRTAPNDAGATERTVPVPPSSVEMLFDDGHAPGLAFWDGAHIRGERLDAPGTLTLAETEGDLGRPCVPPLRDALRFYPLAPRALPFPHIAGMPPSTADARWTLARDTRGVCVSRLEGEGPWGVVYVDATPVGMRGELTLSEGIYPVSCDPDGAASDAGGH